MNKLLAILMFSLSTGAMAASSNVDKSFYKQAATGGMAEVEAGKLAQQKGASEAVKSFGARMVQDHSAANEKLMGIASQKDVTLPKTLDPKHQAVQKRLQAKSGAAFDSAYIQAQIADHKAMASLMERQIKSGKDAEAKAYATETLPVVKEHLQMLQNMKSKSNPSGHSHSHSDLGAGWQVGAADGAPSYPGANSGNRSGSIGVTDSTRSGRSGTGSTDEVGSGSITGSQPDAGTGSNAGTPSKSRTRTGSGSRTATGASSMDSGSNAGTQSSTGEGSITGSQPGMGTGSNAGTQARSGTQSVPASEADIQLNMGTTTEMPAGTETPLTNGSSSSSGSQTNQ